MNRLLALIAAGTLLIASLAGCATKVENESPTATFTVSPALGTVDTEFTLDASGCTDPEEESRFLQVRWDLDGDGTWDTIWGAVKVRKVSFSDLGTHTIRMEVTDSHGAVAETARDITVGRPVQAALTVDRDFGTVDSTFTFDASPSLNVGGSAADLRYQWDYEGDGTVDEVWSSTSIREHTYATEGVYDAWVWVRNQHVITDSTSVQVQVYPANSTPTAAFTVDPVTGFVTTSFQVDASSSSDAQGPVTSLEVRWDWQSDGVWDTQWSTTKQSSHSYAAKDTYTISLAVRDPDGFEAVTSQDVTVANLAPSAVLGVTPFEGTVDTNFHFTTSGSGDLDDSHATLEMRLDWEGDGYWDTGWEALADRTYQFTSPGDYDSWLKVRDPDGGVDSTSVQVSVRSAPFLGQLWTYPSSTAAYGPAPAFNGAGEIVVNDYAPYVLSVLDTTGVLLRSGNLGAIGQTSPVVGSDGTMYVGTNDGRMVAFTPNADTIWTFQTLNTNHGIDSAPAIGSGGSLFFGGNDNWFYVLDTGGTPTSQYPLNGYIHSSPALSQAGDIFFGSRATRIVSLDPSGNLRWYEPLPNAVFNSPAIDAVGNVYIGSDELWSFTDGGQLRWHAATGSIEYASPVIGADGTIYTASEGGRVSAVRQNGSIAWQLDLGAEFESTPVIGEDGTIYAGDIMGKLYAISPSGVVDGVFQMGSSIRGGLTIVSGGILLVRTSQEGLVAVRCRSSDIADAPWPKLHGNLQNTGRRP